VPRATGGGLIQPVFVDDVAAAVGGALAGRAPAGVHDIGGPDAVPFGQLLAMMGERLGKRRLPVPVPVPLLARTVRRLGVGTRTRALHALEMLSYDRVVDAVTAELLGRPPTVLAEGLDRAMRAYGLLD
jgi:NADH dehydrogenase